jgi:hypothetical protein
MQKDSKGFEGLSDASNPDLGEIRDALQGKGEWRPQLPQPSGEDAANGAIGEREAFEAALAKISPHRENGYDLTLSGPNFSGENYADEDIQTQWEVWQARAALTAEKVASEPRLCNLDASPWQCSNCYSGSGECTAQPAQTQVALTDERIRKIAEEHFWGGKCTTADDLEKAIVAALREASLAAQPVSGGKS